MNKNNVSTAIKCIDITKKPDFEYTLQENRTKCTEHTNSYNATICC